MKAADEASTALCSAVQPTKVIEILGPLAMTTEPEIAQACLKMMTCAMNRCSPGDLTVESVDAIIPGILQVTKQYFFIYLYKREWNIH